MTAAGAPRMAEAVDLAAVLSLDRVLEQVLGPGRRRPRPAGERDGRTLAGRLKLGSGIHLVQELLRLLPPAGAGGRR